MNIQDYLKEIETNTQNLTSEIKHNEKLKQTLGKIDFRINSIQGKDNNLTIYTPDYSQVLDYRIITKNKLKDEIYCGPYDKPEKRLEQYSKYLELHTLKQFGDFNLDIILQNEEIEKEKMHILYNYSWTPNEGYLSMPNKPEQMIEFYSSKEIKPSLLSKLKTAINLTEELIDKY
ncbi:hypothetical protein HOD29_00770 [archaeon]|jgi:hypothetical protein|nr:hypothetical protein [archaeon]